MKAGTGRKRGPGESGDLVGDNGGGGEGSAENASSGIGTSTVDNEYGSSKHSHCKQHLPNPNNYPFSDSELPTKIDATNV